MEHKLIDTRITLVRGDIATQAVDAVVNAANSELAPGSGVSGAIHRAGGPAIARECEAYVSANGPVPEGGVALTGGGELAAKWVVHTVGSRWVDGQKGENVKLERCYASSLAAAAAAGARTVAAPFVSTGVYGFPVEPAAMIAIGSAFRFVRENPEKLDEVRFVVWSGDESTEYERVFAELVRTHLG